ncbi:tRNA threonylcarbamoyladenosine dehydratase [Niameybacter massiliensis]|uniref:tRNA threonylcarbamoyladenosine dehydratase n=1 Tax=Holtiella tumoricola TaxID=3018743 RepID=A0AA42DQW5_9FIRM|nr:tRNA threonylcarbamoyladenosine dehydratase [Holtiella tumoricola]MDA3733326.1 tRNA threonylcarbamoyladenosine dehydratase [Holtiella tumoricola]
MLHAFQRTEMLLGTEALEKLKNSKVAVFGVGGVGSYTVEALARTGVGNLVLIDSDTVCVSNINRQIHATVETVGKPKVEVMKERVLLINPEANVTTYEALYNAETAESLLNEDYDYVVDAIDMVTSKIDLIVRCKEKNIPIISAMGAANKLDPTQLEVTDIYKTSVCPLAKVMRHELKKRRVKKLKVVYSKEPALKPTQPEPTGEVPEPGTWTRRQIPASVAFVPSVSGLIIAGEVIKELIGYKK